MYMDCYTGYDNDGYPSASYMIDVPPEFAKYALKNLSLTYDKVEMTTDNIHSALSTAITSDIQAWIKQNYGSCDGVSA